MALAKTFCIAAVLSLCVLIEPSKVPAQVFWGQYCGKGGYGTAYCPNTPSPRARPPSQAPALQYQKPQDDCLKTGWGTPMCSSYGRKGAPSDAAPEPTEESAEKPAPKYQSPQDECGKTGWGVTECHSYKP